MIYGACFYKREARRNAQPTVILLKGKCQHANEYWYLESWDVLLSFVQLFHTKHGKVITAALLGTYGLWLLIGKAVPSVL